MKLPRIVCPYNKTLLRSLRGQELAVRVRTTDHAEEAATCVRESGNGLFCVIVDARSPLADLELRDDLKDIPLAIMAPALGKFRNLVRILPILRGGNIRVYLPCDDPENIVGLRLLSSVGVHSCAVFGADMPDWDALADLMTFAVLERAPHAPIEPFEFIAGHYDPSSYLDWGALFFDDPRRFLHLDAKGRVALSPAELRAKRFVADNIGAIAAADEFPAIRERVEGWRRYFVENHPCAFCGGWKVCLGKFAGADTGNEGCGAFFRELMDVARQRAALRAQGEECRIWQP